MCRSQTALLVSRGAGERERGEGGREGEGGGREGGRGREGADTQTTTTGLGMISS